MKGLVQVHYLYEVQIGTKRLLLNRIRRSRGSSDSLRSAYFTTDNCRLSSQKEVFKVTGFPCGVGFTQGRDPVICRFWTNYDLIRQTGVTELSLVKVSRQGCSFEVSLNRNVRCKSETDQDKRRMDVQRESQTKVLSI